jgi:hypothetical protein
MKIRFLHPSTVRMDFRPGDEVIVRRITPEVQAVLDGSRLDGEKVAVIVDGDDEEIADLPSDAERAVTGRGRGRGQRPAPVS